MLKPFRWLATPLVVRRCLPVVLPSRLSLVERCALLGDVGIAVSSTVTWLAAESRRAIGVQVMPRYAWPWLPIGFASTIPLYRSGRRPPRRKTAQDSYGQLYRGDLSRQGQQKRPTPSPGTCFDPRGIGISDSPSRHRTPSLPAAVETPLNPFPGDLP